MRTRVFFEPRWAQPFAAAGWDSFEKIRKLAGSQIARGDRSGVLIVTPDTQTGIPPFVLKRYRYPFVHMLRTFLTQPKARREFENMSRAREVGMQAPEPLAYGFRKILGFEKESFLLTAHIPQARSLREWRELLVREKETLPPFPRLRAMLVDFASRLARFHGAGQFHHTLYFKNILWSQQGGEDRLYIIDNPWGNRWIGRRFFRAARIRDLACLEKGAKQTLPASARLRFLKTYLAKDHLDEECRVLARQVRSLVAKLENDTPLSRFADDFKHYFHGERYWRTALQSREVFAALPFFVLFVWRAGEWSRSMTDWVVALGLVLIGLYLRQRGLRELSPERKRFVQVCEKGLYARLRQPVSLGRMMILWGACALFGIGWPWLAAALWILMIYWGSNRFEERILSRRVGEGFFDYRKRVPLFFLHP